MSLLKFVKLSEHEILDALSAYVQQIRSVSKPLAIYLFGSMANGSASVESDIDLLIIYNDRPTAKAAQRDVWRQKSPCPIAADLIFVDLEAWTAKNRYSPLIEFVRSEGKLVYQSTEFKEEL